MHPVNLYFPPIHHGNPPTHTQHGPTRPVSSKKNKVEAKLASREGHSTFQLGSFANPKTFAKCIYSVGAASAPTALQKTQLVNTR